MKTIEQQIEIAEFLGYKKVSCPDSSLSGEGPLLPEPKTYWAETFWNGDVIGLPDYLNDLNAMHEAWCSLTVQQHNWFRNHLQEIVLRDGHKYGPCRSVCNATASQRAEAFLRTIGRWRD